MLENQTEFLPIALWLVGYGLAITAIVLAAALAMVPALRRPALWWTLRWTVVAVVLFTASDGFHRLQLTYGQSQSSTNYLFYLSALVTGAGVVLLKRSWRTRFESTVWWNRWGRIAAAIACGLLALGVFGARFPQTGGGASWNQLVLPSANVKASAPIGYAVTDCGRQVALFRYAFESSPARTQLPAETLERLLVVPEASDSAANCHGWVFTGGSFAIRPEDVDGILQDNGYQPVQSPQPGDVIIYRGETGEPMHTGVVKAVGQDGFVLIESKWGPLGAYMHTPEDQVYSSIFSYYRTTRGNHVLKAVPASGDALPGHAA